MGGIIHDRNFYVRTNFLIQSCTQKVNRNDNLIYYFNIKDNWQGIRMQKEGNGVMKEYKI